MVNVRIPQIDTALANLNIELQTSKVVLEEVNKGVKEALEHWPQAWQRVSSWQMAVVTMTRSQTPCPLHYPLQTVKCAGALSFECQPIFLGSKITAGGDSSHEIKRHLFLGRKAMTNLDSILKSRDITLPTKFHLVKAMVFPVVMVDVRVGL